MKILLGEIMTVFSVLYLFVVLLATRNPLNKSWWAKPSTLLDNVHALVIMICGIMGPLFIITGMFQLGSAKDIAVQSAGLLAFLAGTIFILKKMRIKQRLAEFKAMKAKVFDFPQAAQPVDEDTPGEPSVRKAA